MARTENFGLPWESGYGDVQARQHGDTIYISGQVANNRRTTDGANMADQMRQAYANIGELLTRFGATFDNVVEEVLYVTGHDTAHEQRVQRVVGETVEPQHPPLVVHTGGVQDHPRTRVPPHHPPCQVVHAVSIAREILPAGRFPPDRGPLRCPAWTKRARSPSSGGDLS
ncbi:RidA family protein [Kibdelosporangium lantanae]|uniref:RidA family protein n=1 Tax=Kibdelosporangium lantanae TaxID=1497396 RepID=A0ABW3MJV6_9PSEU